MRDKTRQARFSASKATPANPRQFYAGQEIPSRKTKKCEMRNARVCTDVRLSPVQTVTYVCRKVIFFLFFCLQLKGGTVHSDREKNYGCMEGIENR